MQSILRRQLLATAARYADRPALWVDGESYTYEQLYDRAWRLAGALNRHEEEFCLLYCSKNLTRYIAILASVLAGKVFVPICPTSPISYCGRVVAQLGRAVYVLDSGDREREQRLLDLVDPTAPVISTWHTGRSSQSLLQEIMQQPMHDPSPAEPAEHPGAYVMFTSGSTGVPKAVLVTRRNLETYLAGSMQLFEPTPEDRFAQVNNYTFDLSMHDIFLPWWCGASVYGLPETAPFKLPAWLREHHISFWLSVPTTGLSLANLGLLKPGSLPDLRCTLFCGEPLPQRLAQMWHQAASGGRLFNIYGPTEATIAVTAFEWQPDMQLPDVVPIGMPYPGQKVSVVDEQLREVAGEQLGELCLGGDQVVPGYYGNPEQTGKRFVDLPGRPETWYRTGDWVQRHSRWGLQFKGRCDDQLQVRGYRVERLEVETLMRNTLGTDALAIVGWPVVEGNLVQGLVAFVSDVGLTAQQIRRKLSRELPEYMWPSQIYIQVLPQTRSRKVDYGALKQQLVEQAAT